MTKRQLKALKASINHWTRLANGTQRADEKPLAAHCALCKLYAKAGCESCPVKQRTGKSSCLDTPYYKAGDAWSSKDPVFFRSRAQEELNFLKSLLPVCPT